jgi:TonB-linked SusC/RagA family outer membrane protein
MEEVTVVAFGRQKKESVVAAVSTVNPAELQVPSSNLTTAFAGRIAGLISYQRTGEPGQDNAQFFVRGVTTFGTGRNNPLILIDGVEMTNDDLARLTVDDIAAFSIMKDANATALYGARGANGVILVNTNEGKEGKVKVSIRAEGSLSTPTDNVKFADALSYMKLHNEAIRTRDPMASLQYSSEKIYNTERGIDPVRYPANDWQKMLFTDHTFNQRYNMNVSGGGQIARYYIAAAYSRDNGIIKMDKRNNFNNNIQIDRYVLRSNININLSPTTEAIVRLHGAFDDYNGPLDGGTDLYKKAMNANPAYFSPYYDLDWDSSLRGSKHILFGNNADGLLLNPYAEMVKGYKTSNRTDMLAQFEVKQKLDFITQGLAVRGLFNVNRYSLLDLQQSYKPFFYQVVQTDDPNEHLLRPMNPDDGRETLELGSSNKSLTSTMYFEGAAMYNRTFAEKHDVSGLLVYTLRQSLDGSPEDLQASLPNRNLSLAGRLTYAYDSRYFLETNFGYNGSERFEKKERWGFFPSVGAGWIVSNEQFMEPVKDVLSKLKLRVSYGLVGNDDIGEARFFYLANVNIENTDRKYDMGYNFGYTNGKGISISRYADPLITWEISRKTNLALEVNLWNNLEVQVDYFLENRSKIMQERINIPTTMGLQAKPSSNIGKASGHGVELSVDYSKSFSNDFWASFRGNFTYATSKYDFYEEPNYDDVPWRSHKGQKISQSWGYVAERLFVDDEEVNNAPVQFGKYAGGDIKYKDINGDMVIDDNDQVPVGYPTTPEIIYGFGFSVGYRNFDLSCFFQGSARSAFWIDPKATAPFISDIDGFTGHRALLQDYADNHWSEGDRNSYALWPRLSPYLIDNNQKQSTWFMRDGSFLRFKTAEIGYSLPTKFIHRIKIQKARIYVSGNNLMVISAFKMWDPEMAGNGLAYPLQRVFNAGINLDF